MRIAWRCLLPALVVFLILLTCSLFVQENVWTFGSNRSATGRMMIISPTYYPSTSNPRFLSALQTIRLATAANIPILLVDGSEYTVQQEFRREGAIVVADKVDPDVPLRGKGVVLRQAIREALRLNYLTDDRDVILFQECEKSDTVKFAKKVAERIWSGQSDVVMLGRKSLESLPKEQRYSETFANLHLNNVAREAGFEPEVDWFFWANCFQERLGRHLVDI